MLATGLLVMGWLRSLLVVFPEPQLERSADELHEFRSPTCNVNTISTIIRC